MAEPWVSVEDVAAHVGVQKISIYRWIERRGLPATKIGKLWKLKLSEVDAWMRSRHADKEFSRITPSSKQVRRRDGAPQRVVLVIDDDELVRDTVHDFLSDVGYGVLVASDGAEALKLLASASPMPSLIILDLKMPNLDGWRFREQQTSDPNLVSIPVIVVTAVTNPSLEGATVLRKPLRLEQLANAIERLLTETDDLSGEA